ncbi:MAG: PTS sugar transporter subunit IIA [Candidatus Hydrogenedentes bacterium]|nr:PTS sugar transporter subunit IIA [Candidatus Hydrogenedentota bacterium]
MLLGDILREGLVKLELDAEDRSGAIRELVDVLVQEHEISFAMRDHIIEVVHEREHSLGTGIEHGIAVPHGPSERVDAIIGAMGLSRKGVNFESLDGQPTRIVLLLILPRRGYSGRVTELAGVAHLLDNRELRKAILGAKEPAGVVEAIRAHEKKSRYSSGK